MNHNRINIFNSIHKGLRTLLYDTALHIQQTDFTNEDEATDTIKEVEMVVHLFEDHAHNEDNFILPAIDRFDSSISRLFAAEHEEDERLGRILLAAASAWRESEDESVKVSAGKILFYHFNAFVAFNLTHMNKEETVLNNALWAHYTDEEIIGVLQAIIASVPPQIMAVEARYMIRGLNNPEIREWLQGVKHGAPSQVFHMLTGMAEEELHPVRWNAIHTSLADPVMMN